MLVQAATDVHCVVAVAFGGMPRANSLAAELLARGGEGLLQRLTFVVARPPAMAQGGEKNTAG